MTPLPLFYAAAGAQRRKNSQRERMGDMGKFDGVLLASDFDNTLVWTSEALRNGSRTPAVPERNKEALEYFIAQGGRFAISTGRAIPAFRRFGY